MNNTIIVDNENIEEVVKQEIEKLGANADLNHIDVSEVTSMEHLFHSSSFNGDISRWDVSKVSDMSCMFYGSNFAGDLSKWKLSSIKDLDSIFENSNITRENCTLNIDIHTEDERESIFGSESTSGRKSVSRYNRRRNGRN